MSSDQPYTPSDEQIQIDWTTYVTTEDPDNYYDAISSEEADARWSRWLAAHDARVAREALDGLADNMDSIANNAPDLVTRHAAMVTSSMTREYKKTAHPEETP